MIPLVSCVFPRSLSGCDVSPSCGADGVRSLFSAPLMWKQLIVLLDTLSGESANAVPHYHKLCSRDSHIWGIRRGQHNRSAMAEPRPGWTTFLIMVSPLPGKYELYRSQTGDCLTHRPSWLTVLTITTFTKAQAAGGWDSAAAPYTRYCLVQHLTDVIYSLFDPPCLRVPSCNAVFTYKRLN